MPTYTCSVSAGRLTPETKLRLAEVVTSIHAEVTGAAKTFAQVIVREVSEGDIFLGGRPCSGDQLFIEGRIRAGRSALDRQRLILRLIEEAAAATGLKRHAIWVYIHELPARAMAEYGQVLPEPGDEESWIAALPDGARARMDGSGD